MTVQLTAQMTAQMTAQITGYLVVRYEMENQYAIASTAQKAKHVINACHFSMTGLGNEEPKKIPTNVSVSRPEVARSSTGSG